MDMTGFISEYKYFLAFAIIGLLGLSIIFISNAYAGVPSPVPGLGEKAANVKFTVYGTWTHYSIPGVGDSISIDKVTHSVIGWSTYLAIFPYGDSLNVIDTSKAKLHYEVWDSSNNKVVDGDIQFDLTSAWEVSFIVRGLKPNTYTLKLHVFQYADQWPWTGWYERASYEYSFTINPPSE